MGTRGDHQNRAHQDGSQGREADIAQQRSGNHVVQGQLPIREPDEDAPAHHRARSIELEARMRTIDVNMRDGVRIDAPEQGTGSIASKTWTSMFLRQRLQECDRQHQEGDRERREQQPQGPLPPNCLFTAGNRARREIDGLRGKRRRQQDQRQPMRLMLPQCGF